jgi:hypothetical protein
MALSGARICSRLAAWSASHAEVSEEIAWPSAFLVAMGVAEAGRALLGASGRAAWDQAVTLPASTRDLERRSALSGATVRRTLDVLVSAEVLDCHSRIGDELVVQLRADLFEHAPVLAAVAWEHVRDRLSEAVSPTALLVLADLAGRASVEDRRQGRFLPASLRELEVATGSGKGAVRTALGALARAGLIESRLRPRQDSWHRLLAPVFGGDNDATAAVPRPRIDDHDSVGVDGPKASGRRGAGLRVLEHDPGAASVREVGPRSQGRHAPWPQQGQQHAHAPADPTGAAPAATPTVAAAQWAIVEVNGVRLPVPAGVTPQPEQDAGTGEWFLRVGPNTRYGPLRFF